MAFTYLSFCGYGQQWKAAYNTQWCYLYKSADIHSEQLGVLANQASLMVIDAVKDFYKVQVSNGDIGYILHQELRSSKIGTTDNNEPIHYLPI